MFAIATSRVDALPPKQKAAFLCTCAFGLRIDDVAYALGYRPKTAENTVWQAKQALARSTVNVQDLTRFFSRIEGGNA